MSSKTYWRFAVALGAVLILTLGVGVFIGSRRHRVDVNVNGHPFDAKHVISAFTRSRESSVRMRKNAELAEQERAEFDDKMRQMRIESDEKLRKKREASRAEHRQRLDEMFQKHNQHEAAAWKATRERVANRWKESREKIDESKRGKNP